MQPMTWPAHDPPASPVLRLVPNLETPLRRQSGRWREVSTLAVPVGLAALITEGAGQVVGLTFTQDLALASVPVFGGIITAIYVDVRRHLRGTRDAASDSKLREQLTARDEELHADLRRQIRRLEKQLDDMAREHNDTLGLRDE